MFPLCAVISWPFSLKSRFLLTYLVLAEEGGCSAVFGEIALLFLFPLLGVLDFFEGDFHFSSGWRPVSKPFQNKKCVHAIFLLFSMTYIPLISRTELCNSLFLFTSLSRTSSSCIFSSSWLTLWDLGLLEESFSTGSPWSYIDVGDGISSFSATTCSVRSTSSSLSSSESE